MIRIVIVALVAILFAACNSEKTSSGSSAKGGEAALTAYAESLPLNTIQLPEGFSIEVYAEVNDARSMAMSPSGVLYVGNKDGDKVYAVRDTNNDFRADKRWVIASGLNMPNGVAFKDGDLYVAEVSKVSKFAGVETDL